MEGIHYPVLQAGVGMNIVPTKIKRKIGGYIGFDARYKMSLQEKSFRALELNVGVFSGLCFGANLNFNMQENNSTLGFKPFVGIGAYYLFFTYGYNIFLHNNRIEILQNHVLNFHFMIPVYGFTKSGTRMFKPKRKQKDKKVVW